MFVSNRVIGRDNLILAGILYLAYSINAGIVFSLIFQMYDLDIAKEAFFMSAVVFGVMAAVGYFTKKDLSTVGGVLGTILMGVLIVTLLNFFVFHRCEFELFMDYAMVMIFVGIIAYDMSGMKQAVLQGGEENENRIALFMGIKLYVGFMNVYIFVVRTLSKFSSKSRK